MKKLLTLLFLSLAVVAAKAQDLIVMRDGSVIQAKVCEITQTEIKYKKASNPDGPLYTVGKSSVLAINYENGEKESFADAPAAQSVQPTTATPDEPQLVEVPTDANNQELIAKYNKVLRCKEEKSDKKAKEVTNKFGVTSNSILSNKEIEVSFGLYSSEKFRGKPMYKSCCQYGIEIKNKTGKTVYIDLANTFRVEQDGSSTIYFDDSEQVSVNQGGATGGSVGLGSVTGALGIGGTVGKLAGGISVGGKSERSASITYNQQRIVVIPPRGKQYLSVHKDVKVKNGSLLTAPEYKVLSHAENFFGIPNGLKRGDITKGEVRTFNENNSPYIRNYTITYSTDDSFITYSNLKFSIFLQEIIGADLPYYYRIDLLEEAAQEDLTGYDPNQIIGIYYLPKE